MPHQKATLSGNPLSAAATSNNTVAETVGTFPALKTAITTKTFRATLAYSGMLFGLMALAFVYFSLTAINTLDRQLEQTVDAEIRGLAEQYDLGGINRLKNVITARAKSPAGGLYLLATGPSRLAAGNLTIITQQLWDTEGRTEFSYQRTGPTGLEERLALGSVFRLPGGHRLVVGRDIEDRRALQSQFNRSLVFIMAGMILMGGAAATFVSHLLLSRLNSVAKASRRIVRGDLKERIPLNGSGDEFDELSTSLNRMFARIERLVGGYKSLSDNIAHDLTTPLSRLCLLAENGLSGKRSANDTLIEVVEEANTLVSTFDTVLRISRLETDPEANNFSKVDLGDLITGIGEYYEVLFEESGGSLELQLPQQYAPTVCDGALIAQAVSNLIENALKYAGDAPNVSIEFSRDTKTRDAIITVADDGPGIPAVERHHVTERFVRLVGTKSCAGHRHAGNGLGLSIVCAIATHHRSDLMLDAVNSDSRSNPGLKAVLRIPDTLVEAE